MNLTMVFATWHQPEWERCTQSWNTPSIFIENKEILEAYQQAFEILEGAQVLGYVHDDVICHDPNWQERVLAEFADPEVAIVGFAGGPGHGHPTMYQRPFEVNAMGRVGFRSNMRDAERHGARFTGSCNVAILDGFVLFIRRSFLEKAGGWPLGGEIGYFCYDFWACCMARRLGYKIRLVGVDCEHLGGKSTGLNPNLKVNLVEAHRAIYDEFRDVLPAMVTP